MLQKYEDKAYALILIYDTFFSKNILICNERNGFLFGLEKNERFDWLKDLNF